MGLDRIVFHRTVTLGIRFSVQNSSHRETVARLPRLAALNHNLRCILDRRIADGKGSAGNHHLPSVEIAPEPYLDCTLGMSCYENGMVWIGAELRAMGYHKCLETGFPEKIHSFLGFPEDVGSRDYFQLWFCVLVEVEEVHQGLEGSHIRPAEGVRKDSVVVADYTYLAGRSFPRLLDNDLLNYYTSSRS